MKGVVYVGKTVMSLHSFAYDCPLHLIVSETRHVHWVNLEIEIIWFEIFPIVCQVLLMRFPFSHMLLLLFVQPRWCVAHHMY